MYIQCRHCFRTPSTIDDRISDKLKIIMPAITPLLAGRALD